MGKRKLTHYHPKHVQEQCGVWLTAKVPPKQPVLRRLPLSVIQQIYPGPTVDVPNATKQTSLLDFFKKPRVSLIDDSLLYEQQAEGNHKPGNPEKGCSQNRLNEDQSGYFATLQEGEMDEEPPTSKKMRKSNCSEPTIVSLVDTSPSHQQDENRMLGSKTTKHRNRKDNSMSGNTYPQQSPTINDSALPTSRSRNTQSNNFENLPQSTHVGHRKSDCLEIQKCKGADKGNDGSVYEYSSALDSSHLSPSSGLSQLTDSQSCTVTFVPLKRVKNVTSSLRDVQTEEESSPALWNLSGPCDRYKTFPRANITLQGEESLMPPATKSNKLQHINPYLFDTETSHTEFTDGLGESNILTDTYMYSSDSTLNGRVLRVNIVGSELMLNSCSIGESTEGSQCSKSNLSVVDPTLLVGSPCLATDDSTLSVEDSTLSVEDSTLSVEDSTLSVEDSTLSVEDSILYVEDFAPPLVEYPCLSIIDSPSSMPRCDPSNSPSSDFSEFTLNTQGCFVLKEPAHGTSLYEEDSQYCE